MQTTGQSFIDGRWQGTQEQKTFSAWQPEDNTQARAQIFCVTPELTRSACEAAERAFASYRNISREQRAAFLDEIGGQIMALGQQLIDATRLETGLPQARLENERARTVNQLKLFAAHLREPLNSESEAALPERQPLPKPATRLQQLPLGPVVVFGASNFPYAFSTAGGDTASALAAGCPVIVKGHPSHPLTSELTTRAIKKAMEICQMPNGTFSLVQGTEPAIGHQLVAHPAIKAVGFTGSHAVAMSLQKTISGRKEIIPFYGELGSVNPQILLPHAEEAQQISQAQTLCQSLLMGNGQLCTSPGIWLIPQSFTAFISEAKSIIQKSPSDVLLTPRIHDHYESATEMLALNDSLVNLAQGKLDKAHHAQARLFKTDCQALIANEQLQQEIFGPCALLVTYESTSQLLETIEHLAGQLSASIYGDDEAIANQTRLLEALSYKVGRLVFNQAPTGVEVCLTMHHGGPYPSSTDVRHTSVGTHAIDRFLRPICLQNAPTGLFED